VRKVWRVLLWSVIAVVTVVGALFGYFVYTPNPEVPRLSGKLTRGSIEVGGRKRTYLTYVPHELTKGAPLVVVMHGTGQSGTEMRKWTAYGFERVADERGFAVVYPDGYEGYWNGCNIVGDYSANVLNIDDVAFLGALVDTLIGEIGLDPGRVFATGVSRGGSMNTLPSRSKR
jgi:polyhydroxybutyrate depolymerase